MGNLRDCKACPADQRLLILEQNRAQIVYHYHPSRISSHSAVMEATGETEPWCSFFRDNTVWGFDSIRFTHRARGEAS